MVQGYCHEKFAIVREIFEKNINTGFERGAAVAIELEGEKVVDLWGGIDNDEKETSWQKDTIVNVFSTTKGIAAICLLQLVEEEKIKLVDPVSKYWPEFAQNGKENIPIIYLLNHQSGLCGITKPLPENAFENWDLIVKSLAEQKPQWKPGTLHGYHALTFGHLIGEILRRVTGETLGQYFSRKIAKPLGLEFYIGLPDEKFDNVTDIQPIIFSKFIKMMIPLIQAIPKSLLTHDLAIAKDFKNPQTISGSAFSNPDFEFEIPFRPNSKQWRKAEIPAANGHSDARSISKLYGILANGGSRDGIHVLDKKTIEQARQTSSEGKDLVLGNLNTRFGHGFMLGSKHISMGPNRDAFGHGGAGGSLGFADPDHHVSLGFVMNQMHPGVTAWETAIELVTKVYEIKK